MTASAPSQQLDAVIIGAGFAGLYQLHRLRNELGLKVRVLETGGGIGGTWYWNRYPGARCDSESHSYMYYFSKELVDEWEWSERYPGQAEIVRYLNHVADRFDLRRDIQLGTRVTEAAYDEATNLWTVRTEKGEAFEARYVISAVGCLSTANIPKIEGLESFAGKWYHTGQWPHEGVDFAGKRVGIIGTGSTGIQAIPVIAAQAGHLTVFQRTANYSIPARNAPLSASEKAELKAQADEIRHVMNNNTNGHPFWIQDRSALSVSEEERGRLYAKAWEKGGLRFRSIFKDLLVDKAANDTAAEFIKDRIREIVKDPEKARILTDIDHPFASKRPPVDSQYFETYNRDNVSLVNLRETPIERITPAGIRTTAGEHPLDIIVFATGFDAMTGSLLKMDIRGRAGRKLREYWAAGPKTYLGLQVPGFPNLFTITGPGSPSVLCNLPPHIEQNVDWITDCIRHLDAQGIDRIEATEAATEAWQQEVTAAAKATLLFDIPHSWYLGANVPGKPRVFMPYAGGFGKYRGICEQVAREGYRGFALGAAQPA